MRRANFVSILFLTSIAVLAALLLQRGFPILESEQTLGSNLSFLALININIVAVMILAFVVVRNVIRLMIDRKRNILGARLRSRLVFAFVFLSMVPTVLLFLVAQGMIEGVLQDWFSPKIEIALDSSRKLANEFYDYVERDTVESHERAREKLRELLELSPNRNDLLVSQEKIKRVLTNVKGDKAEVHFYVIDSNNRIIGSSETEENYLKLPLLLGKTSLNANSEGLNNSKVITLANSDRGELLKIRSALFEQDYQESVGASLVTVRFIAPAVTNSIKSLLNASEEYSAFKSYQRPLSSSYFLTLVVVTLLIIFAAISIAFALSRGLAVPIGLLARGTEQIANGNLNYHIPELGDDELGVLVKAFNKMTLDLRSTSTELVSRSRYMEAVLSSLEVGVFSVDTEGVIRTFNDACGEILGVEDSNNFIGQLYKSVLPVEFVNAIEEIYQRNLRGKHKVASKNVTYSRNLSQRHLTITLSRLFEESRRGNVGMVILVDDVTDLERAQRMTAWQEVARRIAHEIKNPLTPIQLSAERISRVKDRNLSSTLGTDNLKIISESTEVIINQVQHLRHLVNEFSNFARMPKSELRHANLNDVVQVAVDAFRTSHVYVDFKLSLDESAPIILLDPHQMERVLLNLLDNSVAAITSAGINAPKIEVTTKWDSAIKLISLEVIDNGPGVPDTDKQRIFEPYFSKKVSGTGLGLAIVKTVVSDHNGFIRAFDNPAGTGLVVRIEIPV